MKPTLKSKGMLGLTFANEPIMNVMKRKKKKKKKKKKQIEKKYVLNFFGYCRFLLQTKPITINWFMLMDLKIQLRWS